MMRSPIRISSLLLKRVDGPETEIAPTTRPSSSRIGAATATGHGEEVMRIVGSHTVVELMRQGYSPEEACKKAVERIITIAKNKNKSLDELQIGFIAINKKGEHGAYCLQKGFNYAVYSPEINNQLIDAKHII